MATSPKSLRGRPKTNRRRKRKALATWHRETMTRTQRRKTNKRFQNRKRKSEKLMQMKVGARLK